MNRLKISLLSLLGAVAFTAMAQAAESQATPAADTTANAQADDAKKPPVSDAHCLRHTGTRITSRSDKADKVDANATTGRKSRTCNNGAIGRAYTRDDLDRTGEIDLADALRKLDPSIH